MRMGMMAAAAAVLFGAAEAQTWTLDEKASEIRFVGAQYGSNFEGAFETFDAEIVFDPAAPDAGRAVVTIDLDSLTMKSSDERATAKSWLGAKDAPQARYEVEGFRADGDSFIAPGRLTLNGETQDVDLPFRFEETGGVAKVTGETALDRTAFGVGEPGENGVSDSITVIIDLTARRSDN